MILTESDPPVSAAAAAAVSPQNDGLDNRADCSDAAVFVILVYGMCPQCDKYFIGDQPKQTE